MMSPTRVAAITLGALGTLNGAVMLFTGVPWHAAASSVAPIGHYHEHLIADAGAAFLAAGVGLLVRAFRPRLWFVGVAALGFIVFHGLVHASGVTGGHTHDSIASLSLFAIPALLALWAAIPARAKRRA
jgi:hypothetical protein